MRSAAKPAACGDAWLVPVMHEPPAQIVVPGAESSGFSLPTSEFLKLELGWIRPVASL